MRNASSAASTSAMDAIQSYFRGPSGWQVKRDNTVVCLSVPVPASVAPSQCALAPMSMMRSSQGARIASHRTTALCASRPSSPFYVLEPQRRPPHRTDSSGTAGESAGPEFSLLLRGLRLRRALRPTPRASQRGVALGAVFPYNYHVPSWPPLPRRPAAGTALGGGLDKTRPRPHRPWRPRTWLPSLLRLRAFSRSCRASACCAASASASVGVAANLVRHPTPPPLPPLPWAGFSGESRRRRSRGPSGATRCWSTRTRGRLSLAEPCAKAGPTGAQVDRHVASLEA